MPSCSLATRSSARDSGGVRIPGAGPCSMTTRGRASAGGVHRTVAVIAYGPECTASVGDRKPQSARAETTLSTVESPSSGCCIAACLSPHASHARARLMNQLYGADVGVLGRFDGFAGLPLESH